MPLDIWREYTLGPSIIAIWRALSEGIFGRAEFSRGALLVSRKALASGSEEGDAES
jgi:hypothetical protein